MKLLPRVIGLLALAACQAGAAVATFTPSADTTISEDGLARADGLGPNMIVGHLDPGHADVKSRGLLRFDLSSIPSDSVVTSATLQVTVVADASAGTVVDIHVLNRLILDWSETGASWTWTGLTGWEQSGGDYDPTADGTLGIGPIGTTNFASTPGLIATVQSWVTNAAENYGWVLRSLSEGEGRNARRFSTREAAENLPLLTVGYTAAPPPPPVSGLMTNVRVVNGNFAFDFTALAGTNYTVQFKHAVDATNWLDLVSYPDPGTQTVFTVEHSLAESNRFYRVVTPPTP